MARILHIGGTAKDQADLRATLEADGHEVHGVMEPRRAVEAAVRHAPDLILLEVGGGELEDFETATRLRAVPGLVDTPLITLARVADREMALSLGCDGCLEKPLAPRQLERAVRAFLRGKRERVRSHVQRRHLEAYTRALVEKLEIKVDELTETNLQLRRSDEVKRRIFESVSHDLATPLTPVVGYLSLLESGRLGPLSPRQRRAVRGVEHAIRRLTTTVDRLLDLATLEDVEGAAVREPVFLSELVRESRRVVGAKADSRRVTIDMLLPEETLVARGDAGRLGQAVVYLLDNAIRFVPRGGHVLIELRQEGDLANLSVYDNGEPIPLTQQPLVFEPFANAARPSPDLVPRPDLELALVRRIAEAHGGLARVESPPRALPNVEREYGGARFSLLLPLITWQG